MLGSTNDEALRLARAGAPHGTIVSARQQTAGRGRQGRAWISAPGNIHVSFLFRIAAFTRFLPVRAPEIGFVAALAVADMVDRYVTGSQLKWPNDVLLDGAKIAGILTEMTAEAVVIGIGVNVAHAPAGLPYPVTCLAAHGAGATVDEALDVLAGCLDQRLTDWDAHGFGPIRAAWLARGPAVGQRLTARMGAVTKTGEFAGLADDGALLLSTPDGISRIIAGDVTAAP
jgi:BirA family biotin operon repressor/biotin-[acetyl-CoA-carboxylase] ligase